MWIIQTAHTLPTHEIEHVSASCETSPLNVMMRIDPFLGCANRSVAIYEIFNNALNSLLPTDNSRKPRSPLNYARLKEHFTTFTAKMGIDSVFGMCSLICVVNSKAFWINQATQEDNKSLTHRHKNSDDLEQRPPLPVSITEQPALEQRWSMTSFHRQNQNNNGELKENTSVASALRKDTTPARARACFLRRTQAGSVSSLTRLPKLAIWGVLSSL